MIEFFRNLGITSNVAYLAGMLSIGAAIAGNAIKIDEGQLGALPRCPGTDGTPVRE